MSDGRKPLPNTYEDVANRLMYEFMEKFAQDQHDYGDSAQDLGVMGQYADIHRKMRKLRRAFWLGVELKGEQPREILMDLIGHCFLAIRFLDNSESHEEALRGRVE